jgi:hypothetical protein
MVNHSLIPIWLVSSFIIISQWLSNVQNTNINQETDSNLIVIVLSFVTFSSKQTLPEMTFCCCSMCNNCMIMIQQEKKRNRGKREEEKERRKRAKRERAQFFTTSRTIQHHLHIHSLLFRIWMAQSSVKQLGEFFNKNFSHTTVIC